MQKYFVYLLSFLCFVSCKKNTVNPELLLGDWEFANTVGVSDSSMVYIQSDFRFSKDSIFVLNDGFFQREERDNEDKYMGQKSKFYVENDSLYILNTITQHYFSQKISYLSKNTLALYNKEEKVTFYFRKRKAEASSKIKLSQITLSLGPCFGDCPISSISVDNNGNIVYLGESNTPYNGLFKGNINKEIFQELVSELNKIRFAELKNEYSIDATDLPDISVSFLNDKKIIKTIYAYGHSEPRQLKSILTKIKYLYQNANLKKIDYDFPIFSPIFSNYHFRKSEIFYLQTLLLNSKKTETQFKSKYKQRGILILPEKFDYDDYAQMKRNIESDGRYFKLESKNHQLYTFDIGFDFFKTNEAFSAKIK
ncbi:DUF6438 domain-containing protein [Chryseobacterium binzhouense]|uniref:DUF6438 domain-containing protein n=1 Tax=Chryseobacterium binzhouense TaxID=2593646 RepID=UPI00117D8937|nr:DUF6438 domain-containing protein [Chryseobacterium binzhouense]MXS71730.1 hypothetical protein [Flavobacteriaceae bacterium W22]